MPCARQAAPDWAKSWHQWGLFNLQLLQHYAAAKQTDEAQRHVAPAVVGFFRSVALGQADGAKPNLSGRCFSDQRNVQSIMLSFTVR